MAKDDDKPGLGAGFRAAGRGLRRVLGNREVGKTYLKLVAVLFVLAALLDVAGIWAVLHFVPIDGSESWWAQLGLWLLRIAGIVVVVFSAPLLALFTTNTAFCFEDADCDDSDICTVDDCQFFHCHYTYRPEGVRTVNPARADELAALPGLPLSVSVPQNLIRMALFIGLSIAAFLSSFIPVVGPFLGPVLQAYFTARLLGWEMLDPYFEKLEVRFDAQHDFVRQHRGPLVGFALPFSLVMSIPLVGPLLFGVAQAAAGMMVVEVLEGTPEQPR